MPRLLSLSAYMLSWLLVLSPSPRGDWDSPLPDSQLAVARPFDALAHDWLPGHRGVDLAAGAGSVVTAPADGRVVYAGTLVDRGVVSLHHANGIRSTFEPVTPMVTVGETVTRGQPVATVVSGHPGDTLHWGAKVGPHQYVDPLSLMGFTVVLKPWD